MTTTETTRTTPAMPELTADKAFEILAAQMNKGGPEIQKRINAHIRTVSGKMMIAVYHQDKSIPDVEKVEAYRVCVKAILNKDWSLLQGAVGKGDKRIDPLDIEEAPVTQATTPTPPAVADTTTTEQAIPAPVKEVKRERKPVYKPAPAEQRGTGVELPPARPEITEDAEPQDELARAIFRRLKPYLNKVAEYDEGKIKKLVEEHAKGDVRYLEAYLESNVKDAVKKALNNGSFPTDRVRELIQQTIGGMATTVQVVQLDGNVVDAGRQHFKFPLLLKCIMARIPFILVGPAGSSKSSAVAAAFKALNMEFEAMSVGPMTSKADLFGMVDAHGTYRISPLVRRATQGGGFLVDEVDAGNAGVLTGKNMLLSNPYVPTPEGVKPKHSDFVIGGTANTYCNGSDRQYVGRNQLDAATLDRYAFIDWPYDEGLEASFIGVNAASPRCQVDAGGVLTADAWFKYVLKVRRTIESLNLRHVVSPRATINGARLFAVGVGFDHVKEMVLWKGLDTATRKKIEENAR